MCNFEDTTSCIKTLLKDHPLPVYNSLLGNAVINKGLVVLEGHNIIMRRDHKVMKGKVKIIGGGGAGIEPAESFYVGKGMLTAAVMGEVFTSPSAHEILIAIRELSTENPDGILLLAKNYVGDKLNFGIAMDKALNENINVKMLLIEDNATEVACEKQGRKGMAGSVLVYKIAGGMAEEGKTLEEITEECRENILTDMATVSVTLAPCKSMISSPLSQLMGPDEMILGVGIYGQQGNKKIKIDNLNNAVIVCLEEIFSALKLDSEYEQTSVVVLVNNLGAISKLEESVIVMEVSRKLQEHQVKISEFLAGTFMSSLCTQGFSVTILKVSSSETLKYLCALTSAPGWPKSCNEYESSTESLSTTIQPSMDHDKLNALKLQEIAKGPELQENAISAVKQILLFACDALISCEKQLNIIDQETGDNDAGTRLRIGAEAVKSAVLNEEIDLLFPGKFLFEMSEICCQQMGGLAGALYSVMLRSSAKVFQNASEITPELCCTAFKSGVKAIKYYGKVELGDRTMFDALWPAVETFESAIKNGKDLTQALYLAAATCEYKAEKTKYLKPFWWRDLEIKKPLWYADAGAHSATIWLRAVSEGLRIKFPSEC